MAKINSSEAFGCLVFIILIALALMFASQSDTRSLMVEHLTKGDKATNEAHKSFGTCTVCGKKNKSLTDGKCAACLFER